MCDAYFKFPPESRMLIVHLINVELIENKVMFQLADDSFNNFHTLSAELYLILYDRKRTLLFHDDLNEEDVIYFWKIAILLYLLSISPSVKIRM